MNALIQHQQLKEGQVGCQGHHSLGLLHEAHREIRLQELVDIHAAKAKLLWFLWNFISLLVVQRTGHELGISDCV